MSSIELTKEHLSLAGEYAVARELCRRGFYAQLTLGTRKKTDLLVDSDEAMLRIQVKSKQGKAWLCQGVFGSNIVLVLVDFEGKGSDSRPDFYVLSPKDWDKFVSTGWVAEDIKAGRMRLDGEHCPIWGKLGKLFRGVQVLPREMARYREKWETIEKHLAPLHP